MTRLEIEKAAYRMLNKNATSINTETRDRMRTWLNNRYRRVLSLPGMEWLRRTQLTFDTAADVDQYGLPVAVNKIHRLVDRTNQWSLEGRSLDWLRFVEPDPAMITGDPQVFVLGGYQVVQRQPPLAGTGAAWVVESTDNGDTTQTVRAEAILADGSPRTYSVMLNGTTPAQLIPVTDVVSRITKFYLSATADGTVTLDSVTTTYASIAPGYTSSRYQTIFLWPTPSDVRTLHADVELKITDLAQDTDEPLLPEDFHDVLVYGMCADEALKLDDTRAGMFEDQYADRIRSLKMWLWDYAGNRPVSGRGQRAGFSTLGPWFPAEFYR